MSRVFTPHSIFQQYGHALLPAPTNSCVLQLQPAARQCCAALLLQLPVVFSAECRCATACRHAGNPIPTLLLLGAAAAGAAAAWCCCCLAVVVVLLLHPTDVVVFLSRNLEYCSYGSTALFLTDDFDELEQKYNQVGAAAECGLVRFDDESVLLCLTAIMWLGTAAGAKSARYLACFVSAWRVFLEE
jgi:hypothetical protein